MARTRTFLYKRATMNRLLALLLCILAAISLATGPVAHAAEQTICVEAPATAHSADESGDTSEPAAPEKGVQHQHGGCHGHHFASLSDDAVVRNHAMAGAAARFVRAPVLDGAIADPALRPPQA